MLENRPTRLGLSNKPKAVGVGSQLLPDGRHEFGSERQGDSVPQASITELLRRDEVINSRLRELEATTSRLQREAELESRRLQVIMRELALATGRSDNGLLARLTQPVTVRLPDLSSGAVCALHSERDCVRCQALGAVQTLSNREREVLMLLTEGNRSPSIAARLNICVATVEVHRRNIMRKLGLHTVAALTKYAVREGLTSL